jgi:hypothetical protein
MLEEQGLRLTDAHTLQSAACFAYALNWPLAVDPHGVAAAWVRCQEEWGGALPNDHASGPARLTCLPAATAFSQPLPGAAAAAAASPPPLAASAASDGAPPAPSSVSSTPGALLPAAVYAVKYGIPILVEGVPEAANPAIAQVLRRAISNRNGTPAVDVGGVRGVDYDPRFRFAMTCEGECCCSTDNYSLHALYSYYIALLVCVYACSFGTSAAPAW